jgi:hypothetical protein
MKSFHQALSVCGALRDCVRPWQASTIHPKVVVVCDFEIGSDTGDRPGRLSTESSEITSTEPLIPVDWFYEWPLVDGEKQAHAYSLKNGSRSRLRKLVITERQRTRRISGVFCHRDR